MSLAEQCQSVLCSRVTPGQKADIVTLVRKHTNSVTMCIGDGANDVNMIKSKSGLTNLVSVPTVLSSCVFPVSPFLVLPQLQWLMLVWESQE